MKNLIFKTFLNIVVAMLLGCGGRATLSIEKTTFKENIWPKFEPVEYLFEGSGTHEAYYIALNIAYTQAFSGTELPLVCTITAPSGEMRVMEKRFWLKSLNGTHKGIPSGSLWVAKSAIWPEIEFREDGQYKLEIACDQAKMFLNGIAWVQVEIKKGKMPSSK